MKFLRVVFSDVEEALPVWAMSVAITVLFILMCRS